MLHIDTTLTAADLRASIRRLFDLSGRKLLRVRDTWDFKSGSPVFTERGVYRSRGWTEWTTGFFFGSAVLQFDHEGDNQFLETARDGALQYLSHLTTHNGVHDHGFNIVSTLGNLYRLHQEHCLPANRWEQHYLSYALRVSGAVQAQRWTTLGPTEGYIYSFNGPHSLFIDAMRSLRSLALAWQLGHVQKAEGERRVNLLHRLLLHGTTTAKYNVYFGTGRDAFDSLGRTAHEAIFNIFTGEFRCPSTQQGYSPFTTWMRGLAWALLGFAEQLEFLNTLHYQSFEDFPDKQAWLAAFLRPARAAADFYIAHSTSDGIPFWDTGAPGLKGNEHLLSEPSDPFNDIEPLDSSAAVIAAQGLMRLGTFLRSAGEEEDGRRYSQAGLTVARTLFEEPYLSVDEEHQGLLLHSVYHRPAGWDYIPEGRRIPCGEASLWGDYHARELAIYIERIADGAPYYTFFIKK